MLYKILQRTLAYAFALPIALFIWMISPWRKIRLVRLFTQRIGHYALNTELLLAALEVNLFNDDPKTVTWFYVAPEEPICNEQLHTMWKRVITILPFPWIWRQVDILLSNDDPVKAIFESAEGARDQWNLLDRVAPKLAFTTDENEAGQALLAQLGIPTNAKYICLLGRDASYLQTHLPDMNWSYHDYRNVNINDYQAITEYLVEQGYYVVRMGKHVSEKFNVNHPQVIDYANHPLRSDFMDIYLTAHCYFFISPRTGIDAVAQIFRRPLLLINFPLCDYISLYYLDLFIPKKILDTKQQRLLPLREMCWDWDRKTMMQKLAAEGLQFIDNTPAEMLEVVKEMLGRLNQAWVTDAEDESRQNRFWQSIPVVKSDNPAYKPMRIGEDFLRKHYSD